MSILPLAVAERRRWKLTARKLLCARHYEPYGDNSRSFRIKADSPWRIPSMAGASVSRWANGKGAVTVMEYSRARGPAGRLCALYRRHEAVNNIYCIDQHTHSLLHVGTHCTPFLLKSSHSCSLNGCGNNVWLDLIVVLQHFSQYTLLQSFTLNSNTLGERVLERRGDYKPLRWT